MFPRYHYVETDGSGELFAGTRDCFERRDAISERSLEHYRARYGGRVSADDVFHYVYGLLHSPEYTSRIAAELGKMIPRIPMVEAFWDFVDAGRRLATLHVGYETVEPWPLDGMPGILAPRGRTVSNDGKRPGKHDGGSDPPAAFRIAPASSSVAGHWATSWASSATGPSSTPGARATVHPSEHQYVTDRSVRRAELRRGWCTSP